MSWDDSNATADITAPAASGECKCNTGWYNSATSPNVTCTACHGTCASCNAGTINDCDTCADSNATVASPPGNWLWNDAFYDSNASATIMTCAACDVTCATCSGGNDTDCLTCVDSNSSVNGFGRWPCVDGWIDIDAGAGIDWQLCHASWATCSDTTINGCLTCADPVATASTKPGPWACPL